MGSKRLKLLSTGCRSASAPWAGPALDSASPRPVPSGSTSSLLRAQRHRLGLAAMSAWELGLAAWLTDFLDNYFIYTEQEESNSIIQADTLKVIICVMRPALSLSCEKEKKDDQTKKKKKIPLS